jgi:hypothetical protein
MNIYIYDFNDFEIAELPEKLIDWLLENKKENDIKQSDNKPSEKKENNKSSSNNNIKNFRSKNIDI